MKNAKVDSGLRIFISEHWFFSCWKLMGGRCGVQIVTAGHDGCRIIAVLDLLVLGRESVNIEAVCVEKIRDLLTSVEIDMFAKPEFLSDLKQTLNDFERSETHVWISISCHLFPLIELALQVQEPR